MDVRILASPAISTVIVLTVSLMRPTPVYLMHSSVVHKCKSIVGSARIVLQMLSRIVLVGWVYTNNLGFIAILIYAELLGKPEPFLPKG